jgi:hypothetical protein
MIRPGAAATLNRWREALAGGAVTALGLYWSAGSGLLSWVGWIVTALGAAAIWGGIQRGRFRTAGDGPGIVRLVEGRLAYFGPLTGGMVDLDALNAIRIDPAARPAHWLLDHDGGPTLAIPVNAEGAEALFDVFAALPGLSPDRVLRARSAKGSAPRLLWQRETTAQRIG